MHSMWEFKGLISETSDYIMAFLPKHIYPVFFFFIAHKISRLKNNKAGHSLAFFFCRYLQIRNILLNNVTFLFLKADVPLLLHVCSVLSSRIHFGMFSVFNNWDKRFYIFYIWLGSQTGYGFLVMDWIFLSLSPPFSPSFSLSRSSHTQSCVTCKASLGQEV